MQVWNLIKVTEEVTFLRMDLFGTILETAELPPELQGVKGKMGFQGQGGFHMTNIIVPPLGY